ncbi:MAG: hypothetical protein S4CHLAM37_08280 [Chlamydiia bacterium]|nr:hypothetical protein [Chlamydiia bacterium]
MAQQSTLKAEGQTYSPFTAVFLPIFLTLLGVSFFLRLGWIVGVAGPLKTLGIITLATLISFITAFSLSATATNIRIKTGGIYFLLSRTFGIEIGTAISFPLYIAQTFGVAFYVTGFAEALHILAPHLPTKEIALCSLGFITLIAFISSKVALKAQLFIFLCVALALLSFYFGGFIPKGPTHVAIDHTSMLHPKSFWILFAVFFPSVTGIEGGLALATNLKNPSKTLPFATIAAVCVAFIIYISVALLLYFRVPNELLVSNSLIMQEVAIVPQIVIIGILGSTISAALATIISASKTVQAFSDDGIIPKFFGRVYGKSSFPKIALVLSSLLAFLGVSLGGIDTIAPILSMFFLISYGMLNAATAIEGMIANPSYRPTLKMPWILSFLGALLCLFVMLLINAATSIVAIVLVIGVYFLMKQRHMPTSWEDLRYSILLFFSRFAIYGLTNFKPSPKTWRPNLLVFVGDPLLRAHLIELTSALTHKKGFLIMASISSKNSSYVADASVEEHKLQMFLKKAKVPALIKTYKDESLEQGLKQLIENTGIGPLTPNTFVLGASNKKEKIPIFTETIFTAYKKKKNLLIIRERNLKERLLIKKHWNRDKRIDVWWAGGCKNNSELMLVMAFMLQTSADWRGAKLTLKTAVCLEEDIPLMEKKLKEFSTSSRLSFLTEVVHHKEGDILKDTIKTASSKADLVFLGIRAPSDGETKESFSKYYEELLERTKEFPPIAYILAGEDLEFSEILD